MALTLAYSGLWVHDLDEALAFYTEKLGFELRDDVTLEELGGYRWLTVGPVGQPEVAFALNVPGPPLFDAAGAAQVLAMIAEGKGAGFILNCEDCEATHAELSARGVEFTEPPTRQVYGIDCGMRDPTGNAFRIVQPLPW